MTVAGALAGAGLEVVVVEKSDPATITKLRFDGRTSAIALGSQHILDTIGVWPRLAKDACPIHDIRVTDGNSPLFLHYDHRAVGDLPMGWIIENRLLRQAFLKHAADLKSLTLLAPAEIASLERGAYGVEAHVSTGDRVAAPLVLACDGRNSPLRRAADILVTTWRYPQTAIVCTIGHTEPHHNVAHERFLSPGPFAILPMTDAARGQHRSSIVWTDRSDMAPQYVALEAPDFEAELTRRVGDHLGAVSVLGQRWSFPLSLLHAERYIDTRLALVGDAAHAIHPIAGQGLNMGLRDTAALAEVLVDSARLGLDLGSADVLRRYQQWRRVDNTALAIVTDGLDRIFSNNFAPLRLARSLGIAAVNRLPPLKTFFMRHAMGMVGDLPRLVRGEAL